MCMGWVTVVVPESILFWDLLQFSQCVQVHGTSDKSKTESVKINSVKQSNQSA